MKDKTRFCLQACDLDKLKYTFELFADYLLYREWAYHLWIYASHHQCCLSINYCPSIFKASKRLSLYSNIHQSQFHFSHLNLLLLLIYEINSQKQPRDKLSSSSPCLQSRSANYSSSSQHCLPYSLDVKAVSTLRFPVHPPVNHSILYPVPFLGKIELRFEPRVVLRLVLELRPVLEVEVDLDLLVGYGMAECLDGR
jgi:hypothetical protein